MSTPATRTIADTIYGSTPTGQLIIANMTFTSSDDFVIPENSVVVPVVNGAFSVNLIPYPTYQVQVQVTNQFSIQTWNVPPGSGDLTLEDVLVE